MTWNGLISTILTVNDANCDLASRTIALFCTQTWPQRELIVVNSSRFIFGSDFREIRMASGTPEVVMEAAAIAAAKGDFCVVWRCGCLYTPACLTTASKSIKLDRLISLRQGKLLVGEAFCRLDYQMLSAGDYHGRTGAEIKQLEIPAGSPAVYPARPPALRSVDLNNLNVMCPAGLGDLLWVLAKLSHIPNAIFWLPGIEQRRSGGLARAADMRYGYLDDLATDWVWDQPGNPPLPKSGWITVQANRHLESGQRLVDWYPQLNTAYPKLKLSYQPPSCRYVVGFACNAGYMGGQLQAETWARIFRKIEATVAPVLIVGAGRDVDFAKMIERHYQVKMPPMYDAPVEEVMAVILGAKAMVSVASGLAVFSIAYGVPTLISYPAHLAKMPGTWEPPSARWDWCFHKQLPESVDKGTVNKLLR
jgi:hypothetical protein